MQELDTLIQNIYEDKVLGKVSEDVAMKLIAKYEIEQKELYAEVADLEEKFSTIRQDEEDVALFMERLRKYTDVQELTREMCLLHHSCSVLPNRRLTVPDSHRKGSQMN